MCYLSKNLQRFLTLLQWSALSNATSSSSSSSSSSYYYYYYYYLFSLSLSGDSFEDIDTFISGGDNGGSTLVVAIWGQQRFCFGLLRFWSVVYMGRGWFEGHKNWVDFGCQFPWFMDHCSGCWIDVEMVVVGWF